MRQENPAFAADYQNLYTREFRPLLTRAKESELLTNALKVAVATHGTQTRESGDPYYSHPFSVSQLMLTRDIEDETMLAAGVLHDVLEDTDYTEDSMRDMFGDEITNLVVGVTKLKSRELPEGHTKDEADKEELKRVFDNGDTDPRILVIKLFDRLHNMQTLEHVSPEKQQRKAKETVTYAELARRLGMWEVMTELNDLALKYREPEAFERIKTARDADPRMRQQFQSKIMDDLQSSLLQEDIQADLSVKSLGVWELKKKYADQLNDNQIPPGIAGIPDTVSFRVIVDTEEELHRVTAMLHWNNQNDPSFELYETKDYIEHPQPNGYSVYACTGITQDGQLIEIAVTTREREEINNKGIIAYLERHEDPPYGLFEFKTIFPNDSLPRFLAYDSTVLDAIYRLYPETASQIRTLKADGEELSLSETLPNLADIEPVYAETNQLPLHDDIYTTNKGTQELIASAIARKEVSDSREEGMRQLRYVLGTRFGVLGILDLPDELEQIISNDPHLGPSALLALKIGRDQFGLTRSYLETKIRDHKIDGVPVSKEMLRKSAIVIEGRDEALLTELAQVITDLGGNVTRQSALVEDMPNPNFKLEIVVSWKEGTNMNTMPAVFKKQVTNLLKKKQSMRLVEAY